MMLDDIVSRGRGGPPGQFHDNANGQNGTVQEIMIPAGKAGLVIGKGGETIKQLQVRGRPSELMYVFIYLPTFLVAWDFCHLVFLAIGSKIDFVLSMVSWSEGSWIQVDSKLCVTETGQFCNLLDFLLSLNIGASWSQNDFNSGWFTEHKCR